MKLPPRRREVAELLLSGCSGPEIARAMGIKNGTVRHAIYILSNLSGMTGKGELLLWLYAKRHELGLRCWWDGETYGAPRADWLQEREHIENIWNAVKSPIKFPAPSRRRRSDREIPKAA